MGEVTGGGNYYYGDVATLSAHAFNGYHFLHWNDNVTDNPRTETVLGDVTYTAYFEIDEQIVYTITAVSSNPLMGSVTGGGTYADGSTVTLAATPNNCYTFSQWSDGSTQAQRTITVTGNATYTAYFTAGGSEPQRYLITVVSNNPDRGTVTGGGLYDAGSTITITAEPLAGYEFVKWHDGNTEDFRTVTVTDDATYTAYFRANGTQGIDDISEPADIKIYSHGSCIVVQNAGNTDALVFDILGRTVHKGRIDGPIYVNAKGVYMVKVGDLPVKKVVVR